MTVDDSETAAGKPPIDYGFPQWLWRRLDQYPPPGYKRAVQWRSPLRGPG